MALAVRAPRPELMALIALAATLNLWALSRNGWANQYYSGAVRSMASSWHNFLFASLDPSGLMTVDKPPLGLWVQALSVRVFGYHQLSVLVPQALMGVASVALLYDLVRRRFGRLGGFVAGLALAVTPITVAISRDNNTDALLVLCSVAAVWCTVRALENGRTRWLVLAGVRVGLGFETKMGVALTVVPGIVAAWLWTTPAGRGRLHAFRQLLAGGAAMVVVGGAWPALVELTPAADRPWVSGTSDNSVLSLIFGYNGLGRVDGQTGGPGGGVASGLFGSSPGPLRLLNSALGGQAGWLLGFAVIAGLGMLVASRLRRLSCDRRAVQRSQRDLPSLLRLAARAVHRRAGRRRGRTADRRRSERQGRRPARRGRGRRMRADDSRPVSRPADVAGARADSRRSARRDRTPRAARAWRSPGGPRRCNGCAAAGAVGLGG